MWRTRFLAIAGLLQLCNRLYSVYSVWNQIKSNLIWFESDIYLRQNNSTKFNLRAVYKSEQTWSKANYWQRLHSGTDFIFRDAASASPKNKACTLNHAHTTAQTVNVPSTTVSQIIRDVFPASAWLYTRDNGSAELLNQFVDPVGDLASANFNFQQFFVWLEHCLQRRQCDISDTHAVQETFTHHVMLDVCW